MNAFIACPAMTSRCRFQMAEYVPQARFIRKRWPLWVGHQKEVMSEIATFLKGNVAKMAPMR